MSSSISCVNKDVTISGVDMRKGDAFYIMIHYIHHDPRQWREPSKFEPERFNVDSEWYKTPSGEKCKPFSFSPFLGGQRVCLGKTFAEITLKFMIPLWYHAFDFELVNEEHKTRQPFVITACTKQELIPIKITTRNKIYAQKSE